MDPLVKLSQEYLNTTYAGVAGYQTVPENGLTGWPTVFGITRALQIELGISSPSNNFGDGTRAAFESQLGSISSSTTQGRIIALLNCALWCKGYSGEAPSTTNTWGSIHTTSVAAIRDDLGLATSVVTVTSKMMKSLLTMDAYTKLSGGSDAIRSGQRWLNGKYSSRLNFYLTPTDGLFTRQLQTAIMYAIQFELGMSDSVANGNFGPGTKSGLQTSGTVQYPNTDTTKSFVRLFQLAMACNGYDVPQSGSFGTSTRDATYDFQAFMEIASTGKGDYGTWAALLVSTGDPDRPVTGMDTSTPLTAATAQARYNEGYRVVGRYLTVSGKALVPGELQNIFGAGLKFFPIFQNYNNAASYFHELAGYDHGRQAAIRARELGIGSTPIFFAVDYDATGDEANTIVLDYFNGIRHGIEASVDVDYKVGIYGTRNVCSIVSGAGKAEAVWVSGMSTGYSGNLGFRMPSNWMYNQIKELSSPPLDRNAVSSRANPLTGSKAVPVVNGSFHPLYWGIKPSGNGTETFGLMKLQVMAELEIRKVGLADRSEATRFASQIVMFWLQQAKYNPGLTSLNGVKWNVYTPSFEVIAGVSGDYALAGLSAARDAFYAAAGAITALDPCYPEGDLQHSAATAHGVLVHGSHAGSASTGVGDLGGWALDLVTFWDDYVTHVENGGGQTITQFTTSRLGGSTGTFSKVDLVADADGWLVGERLRNHGATFGDAWRHTLVTSANWQDRVAAFLAGRFGAQPSSKIVSCVNDLFRSPDFLSVEGFARNFIMKKTPPTSSQIDELATSTADRLMSIAGL